MKTIAAAVFGSLAIGSVSAILGGEIVPLGESNYTSYVSLSKGGDPVCGAVLIDSFHVLTAASCTDQKLTYVTVGAQSYKKRGNADVLKIVETRIHPKYYAPNLTYDFAVLTLEKESKFCPIQLPDTDDSSRTVKTGDLTTAFGWGATDTLDTFGLSENLHSVELPVLENGACRDATGLSFINRQYLCAGGIEGKGLMNNDRGGPLILKNKPNVGVDMVVGVSSFTREGSHGEVSVFARVSAELHWIQSQL